MPGPIITTPLTFITGKGGTGKSSLTAGLGRALARSGKQVALVEIEQQALPRYFELEHSTPQGVAADEHITLFALHAHDAFESYGTQRLGSRQLYRTMFDNRFVHYFLDAIPGLGELMCLGMIIELLESDAWDHIIVDLPATGHGLGFLDVPRILTRTVTKGSLHRWGSHLAARLRDPDTTRLLATSLCEELATNEALHILKHAHDQDLRCAGVIANCCLPSPEPPMCADLKARCYDAHGTDSTWQPYFAATDYLRTQWQQQQTQYARLTASAADQIWNIPALEHAPASTFANSIADQLHQWQ